MADEENFPRGKPDKIPTSVKRKSEVKRPETLFAQNRVVKHDKRPKKSNDDAPEGWSKSDREDIDCDVIKPVNVDILQFKKVREGMLILGCVKDIHELELVVSLPDCLTGYVKATRISKMFNEALERNLYGDADGIPPLQGLFEVGQLLVCYVTSLNPVTKSIQLSIDPVLVNSYVSAWQPGMMINACVRSSEGHGFDVDVGQKGVSAFIPTKFIDPDARLPPGGVVRCVVMETKNNGKILILSNESQRIAKALVSAQHGVTLDSIMPGTLVKFNQTKELAAGQVGKFLDFVGSVSCMSGAAAEGSLTSKNTTVACVLYVTGDKHVALSTNPKLWRAKERQQLLHTYQEKYPVGKKCNVVVLKRIKGLAVLCKVDKGHVGVIFERNLSDKVTEGALESWFAKKSHKARVLRDSPVSSILELSCKQSVMEAEFLRYEDVTPGALVQCRVTRVQTKGLEVVLGSGSGRAFRSCSDIRGLVSNLHLSDIILQHPERKFNEGDTLSCRVLTVSAKRKHLHLTNKRTLVQSKLPILTTYDQLPLGGFAHGFVISIKPFGCFVKFYDEVSGFVPRSELSNDVIDSPEKVFYIGQVVKCRLIGCEVETRKLKFSLCMRELGLTGLGKGVNVEIVEKNQFSLRVKIINDDLERADWLDATLPWEHLSDFRTIAEKLFAHCDASMTLQNCIVTSLKGERQVSMKKLPSDAVVFGDLEPGLVMRGAVKRVAEYGVFVELLGGVVGLCPISAMSDRFVATTTGHFMVGQSVVAMVTEIEKEKKRFLVSLRPSDCSLVDEDPIISRYSAELQRLPQDNRLEPGKVVTIETEKNSIVEVPEYSFVLVDQPSDVTKAVVVYDDSARNIVYVTQHKLVLGRCGADGYKGPGKADVHVLFANDDVIMGFITTSGKQRGRLIEVVRRQHWNESFQSNPQCGQTIKVDHIQSCGNILLGNIATHTRVRKDSESAGEFPQIDIGMEVKGEVSSIRAMCALVRMTSLPRVRGHHLVGRIHVAEVMDDVKDKSWPLSNLKVGQTISCHVIGSRDVRTHKYLEISHQTATRSALELSLFRTTAPPSGEISELFPVGKPVVAFVKSVDKKQSNLSLEVAPGVSAFIPKLLVSNQPHVVEKLGFKPGRSIHCYVIKNKPSLILAAKGALVCCKSSEDVCDVTIGHVTNGEVREIVGDGALVRMELRTKGKLFTTDFSDEFVDRPCETLRVGQIIRCVVIGGKSPDMFVLSMRESLMRDDVKPLDRNIDDVTMVKRGDIVRGFIKGCSESGIFVTLSRDVHGRVTFANATKYFISDTKVAQELFYVGKLVTCCVLSTTSQGVELSMLSRDTKIPDVVPHDRYPLRLKRKQSSDVTSKSAKISKSSTKSAVEIVIKQSDFDVIKVDTSSNQCDVTEPGFVWDDDVTMEDKDSDDERETEVATDENQPSGGAEELEKVLLSNPDDSMTWVRLMAVHLHGGDVGRARAVAEKAIASINFRLEDQLLNVWSALFNLENLYGCDVTMDKTIERALKQNDQLKIYQRLAKIYVTSGKREKAEEIFEKMTKKFRLNKSVWIAHMRHLMEDNRHKEAQDVMKRSILSLPKKQHMEVISRLGQLEFQLGEAERGRTLFEGLIDVCPKRTDIWGIYLDCSAKSGRVDETRQIFRRVTSLSLSSKKMKNLFKRFVEFELEFGNDETVRNVKQQAMNYVESQTVM